MSNTLASWIKGDDLRGTDLYDNIQNKYCSMTGTYFVLNQQNFGPYNKNIYCGTTSTYGEMLNAEYMTTTGDYKISFWFRTNSPGGTYTQICGMRDASDSNKNSWAFYYQSDVDRVYFIQYYSGTTGEYIYLPNSSVSEGVTYKIELTKTGTSGSIALYDYQGIQINGGSGAINQTMQTTATKYYINHWTTTASSILRFGNFKFFKY